MGVVLAWDWAVCLVPVMTHQGGYCRAGKMQKAASIHHEQMTKPWTFLIWCFWHIWGFLPWEKGQHDWGHHPNKLSSTEIRATQVLLDKGKKTSLLYRGFCDLFPNCILKHLPHWHLSELEIWLGFGPETCKIMPDVESEKLFSLLREKNQAGSFSEPNWWDV